MRLRGAAFSVSSSEAAFLRVVRVARFGAADSSAEPDISPIVAVASFAETREEAEALLEDAGASVRPSSEAGFSSASIFLRGRPTRFFGASVCCASAAFPASAGAIEAEAGASAASAFVISSEIMR